MDQLLPKIHESETVLIELNSHSKDMNVFLKSGILLIEKKFDECAEVIKTRLSLLKEEVNKITPNYF